MSKFRIYLGIYWIKEYKVWILQIGSARNLECMKNVPSIFPTSFMRKILSIPIGLNQDKEADFKA
jgi:hypothetical protein